MEWLGLVGALLGASVGGGIAHLNAWRFAKRQETRAAEQETRKEKSERLGLAYAIIFKVQRATEVLRQTRLHALGALEVANAKQWMLWQALRPFFGVDRNEAMSFSSAELALFATHQDAEYANQLLELATVYNLTLDLLREFRVRRETFADRAQGSGRVQVSAEIASFESTDGNLHLLSAELDQLALSIAHTTNDGAQHAVAIANEIGLKLRALLQDDRFTVQIRYSLDDETSNTTEAKA